MGRGFFIKSAASQLQESFSDQAVELLRLRDEGLHPVLSKLRLKRHNILGAQCVADLAGEREHRLGIFLRDLYGSALHILDDSGHGI